MEFLLCDSCQKIFDFHLRQPMIIAGCGHTICKHCGETKIVKNEQGMYVCPFDSEDVFD